MDWGTRLRKGVAAAACLLNKFNNKIHTKSNKNVLEIR